MIYLTETGMWMLQHNIQHVLQKILQSKPPTLNASESSCKTAKNQRICCIIWPSYCASIFHLPLQIPFTPFPPSSIPQGNRNWSNALENSWRPLRFGAILPSLTGVFSPHVVKPTLYERHQHCGKILDWDSRVSSPKPYRTGLTRELLQNQGIPAVSSWIL